MKKILKSASALALLTTVLIAPASAYAQSGHRICGQWAALPNNAGYAGILVEVKNGGSLEANQACDKARHKSPNEVFASASFAPYLASMTWHMQGTTACENLGQYFMSADHPNQDMCQYMNGYTGYAVVKSAAANTTTYAQ
ncbi:MAG: hypothetical protein WC091_02260 [Sulfuricellaceae bacterium]